MILNQVCLCAGIGDVVAEEFTQPLYLFDPRVVGEQSVVPDAVEATGQDMQEKASDELAGGQGMVL
jgi:hypothetical protein